MILWAIKKTPLSFLKTSLIGLVYLYKLLSPATFFLCEICGLRVQCKYPESCSNYALRQIQSSQPVVRICWKIIIRLFSCSPWGELLNFKILKRKGL